MKTTHITYGITNGGNHFNGEIRIAGKAKPQTVRSAVRRHAARRGFTSGIASVTATRCVQPLLAAPVAL